MNASKLTMVTALGLAGVLLAACGGKPRHIDVEAAKEARKGIVETAVIDHPTTATATSTSTPSPTPTSNGAKPAKPWLGVTASRGKRDVVAAWSKSDVVLSSDGGKSFHKVLSGPGLVERVAVDARGTAFAIRHVDELGVRDTDGATKWRAMPFVKRTTSLTTGAGVVAWLGMRKLPGGETREALALSKDQGDTWTFPELPTTLGDFANDVLVEDDGTVRVMTASEADCGGGFQSRFVGNVASGEWKELAWPIDAPGNFGLGAGGWAYGVGDCGGENHLCASGADGNAVAVAPVQSKSWKSLRVVTDGKVAWGILDGQLAYLSGATVMFPAVGTPSRFVVTGIDAEGQPIGLANGKALRWTRAGKWQPLFAGAPHVS